MGDTLFLRWYQLKLERIVACSPRFVSCIASDEHNEKFFARSVALVDSAMERKLQEQLRGAHAFYAYCRNRRAPFETPQFLKMREGSYVSNLFPQQIITGKGVPHETALHPFIGSIADILVWLIKAGMSDSRQVAPFDWSAEWESSHWVPAARGVVGNATFTRAQALINRFSTYALPGPVHGTFIWHHLLNLGNGKLALVDAEKATFQNKPRLYDVASLYSRIVTLVRSQSLADALLVHVFRKLGWRLTQFEREFTVAIVERGIGVSLDAQIDYENGHRDNHGDYRCRAAGLLDMCFTGKIFAPIRS